MVPPTKKIDEMFEFFLQQKAQAAVVLNEFGGIDGLVTLKHLVNFVFGHASGEAMLQRFYSEPEPGVFEVDGSMKLTDFNHVTNLGIVDNRMTTIGGVILRHLDRLPAIGDEVNVEGIRLQVVALEGHRISSLRATTKPARRAEAGPDDGAGPIDEAARGDAADRPESGGEDS